MKYKVLFAYGPAEIILETNDKQEAINKLIELDGKDYNEHLDYLQHCAEVYERPADFYPSYYIQCDNNEMFDITDYRVLERRGD